jgi:hypothetical protein
MPDRRTLEGVEIARVGTFRCRPASTRSPASSSPPPSPTPRSTRRASGSATRTRASTCRSSTATRRSGRSSTCASPRTATCCSATSPRCPRGWPTTRPPPTPAGRWRASLRATTSRSAPSSCSAPRSQASRRSPISRRRSPRPSRPARPPRTRPRSRSARCGRARRTSTTSATRSTRATRPTRRQRLVVRQEVQINPNQLIVEHSTGDGSTYRVPWSVNTDGTFSFGDLVEVTVEYRDVAASAAASRVIHRAPASRPNQKEESIVDPKILREQLGLAEDASDEDVTAKLAELNARPTEEQVEQQVSEKVEEQLPEAVAAASPRRQPRATTRPSRSTRRRSRSSRPARPRAPRRTTVSSRGQGDVHRRRGREGQVPAVARRALHKRYDSDPEGTRAEIDALADDVVPVTERGIAASSEETPT